MADAATCPRCGRTISAGSPTGACPRCSSTVAHVVTGRAVPTAAEVAASISDFEILGVLGQGGMGVVFKARQRSLERVVAIKVLPPAMASGPHFAERFRREATAMARLAHPNVVSVHEYGVEGGLAYLVIEFVDGLDLRKAMATGLAGPRESLAIVAQICDALQYAHDRGVVHRDIKPENILLGWSGASAQGHVAERPSAHDAASAAARAGNVPRGTPAVKVADFGLAKLGALLEGDPSLTRTDQVMGTPRYMAPEQWQPTSAIDSRADIYSLGVVLYEMLTGELPIGRFEPPSRRCGLDERIDEVVLRALERDRERRWPRADEMKARLAEIAAGPDVAPRAVPTPRPLAPQPAPEAPGISDPGVYAQYSAAVAAAGSVGSRLEFDSGDLTDIPFPDESLDKIVASLSIHNADDRELRARAVRELVRVLVPGGSVALVDLRQGESYADELRAAGMQLVEDAPVGGCVSMPVRVVTARRGQPRP